MTPAASIDRIREIVGLEGGVEQAAACLAVDDDLFDAGLSSFGVVRVLVALEEQFGIEIPDEPDVFASFSTLRRIEALVHKTVQTSRTAPGR